MTRDEMAARMRHNCICNMRPCPLDMHPRMISRVLPQIVFTNEEDYHEFAHTWNRLLSLEARI